MRQILTGIGSLLIIIGVIGYFRTSQSVKQKPEVQLIPTTVVGYAYPYDETMNEKGWRIVEHENMQDCKNWGKKLVKTEQWVEFDCH